MERKTFLAAAAALAAVAASGPMVSKADQPNGSDRSLVAVRARLQSYIDQLQRDQRDYGGHRASAVQWLQRAVSELTQAIQYDRMHH